MATLKSYQQFAFDLTPEQKAEAETLLGPAPTESLMCYSDRAADAEYFKPVLFTAEEYELVKDVIWESCCPPEDLAEFETEK